MNKWLAECQKIRLEWWVLLVSSVIYFVPYWQTGLPVTHDGENHVARFAQFYLAWRQGQIIPRLGPTLQNGFGYPVFNYNYPLANIFSVPLTLLKVGFETEFKLLAVLAFVVGGVAWTKWLDRLLGRRCHGWSLMTYLWSPYLWHAIWVRGSMGEIVIYALLPVVAWQIERYRARDRGAKISLAIALACFWLAHNVLAFFGSPLVALYALWRLGGGDGDGRWQFDGRRLSGALAVALVGLGLTAWFWLPALAEKNLVILDEAGINREYRQHFVTLAQLTRMSVGSGLSQPGTVDGLGFGVGAVAVMTVMTVVYLLIVGSSQVANRRLTLATLLLIALLGWGQLAASARAYEFLPLVYFIQFPWRLSLLMAFLLAFLVAQVDWSPTGKVVLSGAFVWQLLVGGHGWPAEFFHHPADHYLQYPQSTTTRHEDTAKTFTYNITEKTDQAPQIIAGDGEVTIPTGALLSTTRKNYHVSCQNECVVVEQTANFPGFVTTANGVQVTYYDDATVAGRIAYQLDSGDYEIVTHWTEGTWPRLLGDAIALFCVCILGYWWYDDWKNKVSYN